MDDAARRWCSGRVARGRRRWSRSAGPHIQTVLAVVPGLIVGNPIIIKPPLNRMLGYFLADAAAEAGIPEGVLSVLAGDAAVSEHLVRPPDITAVHFTGGNEVGSAIMRACADRIAHVTLELDGKSAAIVAADADLDQVVPAVVGRAGGRRVQTGRPPG